MSIQRSADPEAKTRYRSSRITAVNGRFFFSTREGTLEGPFISREDAEQSVLHYIERMKMSEQLLLHCNEHIDNIQRRAEIKHTLED